MPERARRLPFPRREPCPHRILDDIGGAFGMGAVGGGIWNFGKGMYNSPKGLVSRVQGGVSVRFAQRSACPPTERDPWPLPDSQPLGSGLSPLQAVRFEAPRLGGSFAIWGGLFSVFDCTLIAIRKKASNFCCVLAITSASSSARR